MKHWGKKVDNVKVLQKILCFASVSPIDVPQKVHCISKSVLDNIKVE